MSQPINSRRRLLLQASLAVPAAAALGMTANAVASTLSVDDPMAQSFGYMPVSDKDGQTCDKCKYFAGESEPGVGRCRLFRANVESAGWCSNWSL